MNTKRSNSNTIGQRESNNEYQSVYVMDKNMVHNKYMYPEYRNEWMNINENMQASDKMGRQEKAKKWTKTNTKKLRMNENEINTQARDNMKTGCELCSVASSKTFII